ncbi:amidohydrolase family protein [Pseudonocardia sp. GCM10023141]|uniref:amidohydrolase family protein n=1 Tax=Pseudonocardia sp. GCM10023141 TaxID=3252653 RepID=UPI00360B8910
MMVADPGTTGHDEPVGELSGLVDSCVFLGWKAPQDIISYLPSGWREYLTPVAGRPYRRVVPDRQLENPEGERLAAPLHEERGWRIPDADLAADVLSAPQVSSVIACPDQGLMASVGSQPTLSLEVSRASNRFLSDQVAALGDDRVRKVMVIPTHLPTEAVAEIRRNSGDDTFVGVAMGANGLGKPFGHPVYHDIYRTAAELDLPVLIHVGSEWQPNVLSHPTGGGIPNTFAELYALRAQSVMGHLTSLVGMGVLEDIPNLRVMVVGAGVTWLPSFLWRFDNDYKAQGGIDSPWLKRLPSEYLRSHLLVTTYAIPGSTIPPPQVRALQTIPWLGEMITYASGYPSWDANHPQDVVDCLPAGWRHAIMNANARKMFRLP